LESDFDVLIYGFVLIQMFENYMTHAIPDMKARKNSFYTQPAVK
jgi:hypothetical protein